MGTEEFDVKRLVGLQKNEAVLRIEAEGLFCRIRSEDGVARIGTCDIRNDRVNLTIERNTVVHASVG